MSMRGAVLGVVMGSLAVLGCGGDGDGANCSAFAACGGDVVGEWNIDGICGLEQEVDESCPAATVSTSIDIDGTISFGADGAYLADGHQKVSARATYPASCLEGVTSCDQLAGTSTTVTCSGSPSTSCTCSGVVSDEDSSATGTYVATGSNVTITFDSGSTGGGSYCVEGTTLKLQQAGSTSFLSLSK